MSSETPTFEKTIDLPSCGLLDGSRPRLGINSMSLKAEKVVYTGGLGIEKLVTIVRMCSDASEEEILKFPLADLLYGFVRIRVLSTESPVYFFRVKCQEKVCGDPFQVKANFDEMKVDFLEDRQADSPEDLEPFSVELKKAGKELKLRFLRVSDQIELEKDQKKKKSKGIPVDERNFIESLARRTVSIGGESKREIQYVQFYENLTTFDGFAIKNAIKANDFGLDMLMDGICPHCGSLNEYLVKMDDTFFRPQSTSTGEAA